MKVKNVILTSLVSMTVGGIAVLHTCVLPSQNVLIGCLVLGACLLITLAILLWLLWKDNAKKLLTLALVTTMACQCAQAATVEKPPKTAVMVCATIIVLVGAGYMVYKICKVANRLPAPERPARPPQAPPARTNNPTTGKKKLLSSALPELTSVWDISGHGVLSPEGTEYNTMWTAKLSVSTNLTDWRTLQVTGWVSHSSSWLSFYEHGTPLANVYSTNEPVLDLTEVLPASAGFLKWEN